MDADQIRLIDTLRVLERGSSNETINGMPAFEVIERLRASIERRANMLRDQEINRGLGGNQRYFAI